MTLGMQRARTGAALILTMGFGATGLGGCANLYMVDEVSKKEILSPAPTMAEALTYSNALKTKIVKTAETPFDIGQGVGGVFIAAAGAATALLAFDGNQAAAAGVGLGAGALGLTDRFLLVDESLAIYKNAVEALNCAESLLVPLADDPDVKVSLNWKAKGFDAPPTSFAEPRSTFDAQLAKLPLAAQAVVQSTAPAVAAADGANDELMAALRAASDSGQASGRASKRLVLFADQVRQTVNATILQKRATTEELSGAFKTIVGDYVKSISDKKEKAKKETEKAATAQQAVMASAAATNAAQFQALALDPAKAANMPAGLMVPPETFSSLTATSSNIEAKASIAAAAAANVPDETKIQACLVKVAGGGGTGSGGSNTPGS